MSGVKESNFITPTIFCLIVFIIALFLTLDRHNRKGWDDYHGVIFADKAGYYVYLPSLFIYHFNPNEFSPDADDNAGFGFVLDSANAKVQTKYFYGTALLQAPFFLIAHAIAPALGEKPDGFSHVYQVLIIISTVFYLAFGFFILFLFLRYYFPDKVILITLSLLFAGTNIYFYTIDETGMSHIYSLFVFSLLLWSVHKYFVQNKKTPGLEILIGFTSILTVFIRPTNVILMLVLLFLDINALTSFKKRLQSLFKPRMILVFLFWIIVLFTPQILYWLYLKGEFIAYTYENESFTFWKTPKVLQVFFSTQNGLFLYVPLMGIIVIGMLFMIIKNLKNGILITTIFLLLTYICASWHSWSFGCAYGQRSYVEYFAIFALPLGHMINLVVNIKKKLLYYIISVILILFVLFNISTVQSYDKCFPGGDWEWIAYKRLIFKSFEKQRNEMFLWANPECYNEQMLTEVQFNPEKPSGKYIQALNYAKEYGCVFSETMEKLDLAKTDTIEVKLWTYLLNPSSKGKLVVSIHSKPGTKYWNAISLDDYRKPNSAWIPIEVNFMPSIEIDKSDLLRVYIWNHEREDFYVDDMQIRIK